MNSMDEVIELTKAERIAKEKFLYLCTEGQFKPCDSDISKADYNLPIWYDREKYKRGQKYFHDNRNGILSSKLVGLICLLADYKGIKILMSTGRSSTPETARKRYVSTVVHTLTWYEIDLSPGSKSLESLKRTRKLHYHSSESAKSLGIGHISQTELSLTVFGFMGFAILHPHMFGIRCDNQEDREGFVHLWAVLCHILGVEDRFNICLLPFDALLVFCQMVVRYILLPLIQIETPEFKHMVKALLDGLKKYLVTLDYEMDLFAVKRLLGVPGYQYRTNDESNMHCRSLLNQNDVDELNKVVKQVHQVKMDLFSVDIPVIEVTRCVINESYKNHHENKNSCDNYAKIALSSNDANLRTIDYLRELMQLKASDTVILRYIKYEKEWTNNIDDSKFYQLTSRAQFLFNIKLFMLKVYKNWLGRYIIEGLFSFVLYRVKNVHKELSSKSNARMVQTA